MANEETNQQSESQQPSNTPNVEQASSVLGSELISEESKQADQALQELNILKLEGAQKEIPQMETDAFQCARCREVTLLNTYLMGRRCSDFACPLQRKTTYYQAQTRSIDEPMTVTTPHLGFPLMDVILIALIFHPSRLCLNIDIRHLPIIYGPTWPPYRDREVQVRATCNAKPCFAHYD
ncbi:hypothetical protein DL93DRAFT_2097566 [Clavulina sp. PMI_390]|nr:hypothetical protein DL93DRAFT_2097566 [Clavulina sp. PMI_390]